MGGKYINGGSSPGTFGPGPAKCGNTQATAYDVRDEACFPVYGVGIIISDTTASIQGGFEVCNYNFHKDGTQRPVVSILQLQGPVSV